MRAPSAPSAPPRRASAGRRAVRELVDGWGGVTIAYRRRLIDAPSYTLNHEEVGKALEEGIRFAEGLTPTAIEVDELGRCAAIRLARAGANDEVTLPARAVLVAAGTRPNTVLAREYAEQFGFDGQYFQAVDEQRPAGEAGEARQAEGRPGAAEPARRRPRPSASSATCIRPSPATW